MSKHSDELLAEIERIALLKTKIPPYKVTAAKNGVSVQVIRRLVHEALQRQRMKIRIHVEHSEKE